MSSVYPADYFNLARQIKMRQIDEFLMQVQLYSYPHMEPEAGKEFVDGLLDQRDWFRGDPNTRNSLDRVGMEALKNQVRGNSRFGKVRQKGEQKPGEVLE